MDHQETKEPLVEKELEMNGKQKTLQHHSIGYDRLLLSQQSTFLMDDDEEEDESNPSLGSPSSPAHDVLKQHNNSRTVASTPSCSYPLEEQYHQHHKAPATSDGIYDDDHDAQQEGDMSSSNNISLARLLLVLSAAIFGINFSMVKILDNEGSDDNDDDGGNAIVIPAGESVALRFALAALVTSPSILCTTTRSSTTAATSSSSPSCSANPNETLSPRMGAFWAGLETGIYVTVGVLSQAIGLETTSASKSAFLFSLAMVVVPLLDLLVTGKPAAPRQWMGASLALLGVAFMELESLSSLSMISRGDLISLLQPLAFGTGFWRLEHWMHRFPDEAKLATAYQVLTVFVCSTLYSLVTSEVLEFEELILWLQDPKVVLALFWTSVMSTALALNMQTYALRTLSATEVTLLLSTEPLWGAIFAALLLGERFTWQFLVGGVFIMSGCLCANLDVRGLLRRVGCCTSLLGDKEEEYILKGKEVEMGDTHSVMSALTGGGQGRDTGYGSRSVPTVVVSVSGEP